MIFCRSCGGLVVGMEQEPGFSVSLGHSSFYFPTSQSPLNIKASTSLSVSVILDFIIINMYSVFITLSGTEIQNPLEFHK